MTELATSKMLKDLPYDEKVEIFKKSMNVAFPEYIIGQGELICIAELYLFEPEDVCRKCTLEGFDRYMPTPSMIMFHPDFYSFKERVLKDKCKC